MTQAGDAETGRIAQMRDSLAWRRWGPYVSDRQWGTVREDYSADGDAWAYFPHDHARSRAYRWGEDGIGGGGLGGVGQDVFFFVPWRRAGERAGSDLQGSVFRNDQCRRHSRRRLQGI